MFAAKTDYNNSMIILWFRNDLRLNDNPALNQALALAQDTNHPVCPIYILDSGAAQKRELGGASKWWLHHSLAALAKNLEHDYGLTLHFYNGAAQTIIADLCQHQDIKHVLWNKSYDPWQSAVDNAIADQLSQADINLQTTHSFTLKPPQSTCKPDGTPYKVFTPFYRKHYQQSESDPRAPIDKPSPHPYKNAHINAPQNLSLGALSLLPKLPWADGFSTHWTPGEQGAHDKLNLFLDKQLSGYKIGRDFMNQRHTSYLSPHLHFGEISPHTIWERTHTAMSEQDCEDDGEAFLRELVWRDFATHTLSHFPTLPDKNIQTKFNAFPWAKTDSI